MKLYLDQVNCSLNRAHGLARQHMETQFGCFACHSGPWNELKLEEGVVKAHSCTIAAWLFIVRMRGV